MQIRELQAKINDRFSVSWDDMVMALCQCNLVVDDAFYFLQRDMLGGLYAYLTTDYSEVTEGVAEMEFLKKTLVNRMDNMGDDEEKTQVTMEAPLHNVYTIMPIHVYLYGCMYTVPYSTVITPPPKICLLLCAVSSYM